MDSNLNGNAGALLVLGAIVYLGWSVGWQVPWFATHVDQPKTPLNVGSPSAEGEVDPTRWAVGAYQPVTQTDGNRPPIPDPYVEWHLLPSIGGTAPPPKLNALWHGGPGDLPAQSGTTTTRFQGPKEVPVPRAGLHPAQLDTGLFASAG